MSKIRILIAEDNEDNQILMRMLMERANYEVQIASNGIEALEAIEQRHPDLLLLDLTMPEMDGWTVASKLKSDPATSKIPIIAITAHALPHEQARALNAGCDGIVIKPFTIFGLTKEIARVLPVDSE